MNQNIKNNIWMYLTFSLSAIVFMSAVNSESTKMESVALAPYVGEIIMFAGDFSPRNYVKCDGGIQSINTFGALYGVLRTRYGGDGQSSVGVPNLEGRLPAHYTGKTSSPEFGSMGLTNHFYSEQVNKAPAGATQTVEVSVFDKKLRNRQPHLGINFCIALTGRYPSEF